MCWKLNCGKNIEKFGSFGFLDVNATPSPPHLILYVFHNFAKIVNHDQRRAGIQHCAHARRYRNHQRALAVSLRPVSRAARCDGLKNGRATVFSRALQRLSSKPLAPPEQSAATRARKLMQRSARFPRFAARRAARGPKKRLRVGF